MPTTFALTHQHFHHRRVVLMPLQTQRAHTEFRTCINVVSKHEKDKRMHRLGCHVQVQIKCLCHGHPAPPCFFRFVNRGPHVTLPPVRDDGVILGVIFEAVHGIEWHACNVHSDAGQV